MNLMRRGGGGRWDRDASGWSADDRVPLDTNDPDARCGGSRGAYAGLLVIVLGLLGLLLPGVVWGQEAASRPDADRALVLTDSSYVDFGNPPGGAFDLRAGGHLTLAVWLRYNTPQYHAKIFDKQGASNPGYSFYVQQASGLLGIWLNPGDIPGEAFSLRSASGRTRIADGLWHHIALVQQDTLLVGYVDGREDVTLAFSDVADRLVSPRPLWFGWDGNDVIHFTGAVDEVSIWSRALSPREIRRLMYRRPDDDEAGLVGYWPFDEDTGTRTRDHGPNGYHARVAAPTWVDATRPTGPPWYTTWWFYAFCGLGGVGLIYGLMLVYTARIRAQNRRLEVLIAQRTGEVKRQAEELRALNATKSQLYANISHEFRTPLTLSIGPLEDVVAGRHGAITEETRRQVNLALLNNRRLLRLVNQLLDIARLEAQRLVLHVRPVELTGFLASLARAFQPLADRKDVTLTHALPQPPVWVYADPSHLEKIVLNLLSNAFKFTPEGGRILLTLKAYEDEVCIEVRDSGPGIPADQLPFIFDRFHQVEVDALRHRTGTGIGLALSKELVEMHGGRIDVESVEGWGTTFRIHLRFGKEHFAGTHHEVQEESLPSPKERALPLPATAVSEEPIALDGAADDVMEDRTTVLIVDDNAEIRAFLRRHLDDAYRVVEAINGAEGLRRARALTPDLVLSDVMMPEMDGYAFCHALKADPELDFIPVILLTARAETEDRVTGLEHGADDYLTKPFNVEELKARVQNLITQRQRLRVHFSADGPPALPALDAQSTDVAFLERVKATVEARLADPAFNVAALADAVAIDRTHLYRRLKELADVAPTTYIRRIRLERAARLLVAEAGNVSEIAYGVGFQSVPYFTTSFRKHFGCTPTQYVAEHAPSQDEA